MIFPACHKSFDPSAIARVGSIIPVACIVAGGKEAHHAQGPSNGTSFPPPPACRPWFVQEEEDADVVWH